MTILNPTITVNAVNKLPHGTVRRAPAPSFAHAILLDQMDREQCWQVVDLYGPMAVETDVDVQDWPIVYLPAPDEIWQEVVPPIPFPPAAGSSRATRSCAFCSHLGARHLDNDGGACLNCDRHCAGFVEENR